MTISNSTAHASPSPATNSPARAALSVRVSSASCTTDTLVSPRRGEESSWATSCLRCCHLSTIRRRESRLPPDADPALEGW
jgi:hypothetical protein